MLVTTGPPILRDTFNLSNPVTLAEGQFVVLRSVIAAATNLNQTAAGKEGHLAHSYNATATMLSLTPRAGSASCSAGSTDAADTGGGSEGASTSASNSGSAPAGVSTRAT